MHNPVLNVTEGDRAEHDRLSLYLRGAYREDTKLAFTAGASTIGGRGVL